MQAFGLSLIHILLARIKTVLKRSQHYHLTAATEEPICGDLLINRAARTVTLKKKQLNLTPKEFDLLFFLYKNKNVALSRNQILDEVWGELFDGDDRTVDTHIKMLRNNLGEYRNIIKTVWGIGYKLETNDSISPNPNES